MTEWNDFMVESNAEEGLPEVLVVVSSLGLNDLRKGGAGRLEAEDGEREREYELTHAHTHTHIYL